MSTLQHQLSAADISDYEAYFATEPYGCAADDHRTAIIAYTVASCFSTKKLDYEDFLPSWQQPEPITYAQGALMFEAYLRSL